MYLCVNKETLNSYNHESNLQQIEDHAQRLVSEKGQHLDVVLNLPAQGLAQREAGDHDGEDRGPPDGGAEGCGMASAGECPGRLLRQQQNVLRRLTITGGGPPPDPSTSTPITEIEK